MEFNDEQSKPSYQVPATTAQVVSNISTTTQFPQPLYAPTSNVISSSSPVVIDLGPDGVESNSGISLKNQDPPPGFCPSDLELLTLYLKRKVLNQQLPSNRIVEVELYNHSPEWLTGQHPQSSENEWYFFSSVEGKNLKKSQGIFQNQSTNDGFWEAFGDELQIQENGIVAGFKKELHFYRGKPPKGVPTNWVMDEYRLEGLPRTIRSENGMTWDEYVLCRIYKKSDENLSRICNNPVVCPKFPTYNVQGMRLLTEEYANNLQAKRANYRTQMVEPIPAMPYFPNKSSRYANAIQAVGCYGGPPQMVEPTPWIYKKSDENLSRIHNNLVIPELHPKFLPQNFEKILRLTEKYFQALHAKYRTQMVEPIPALPSFPKSSRYANAIPAVGSYRSRPQMFKPIPSMLPLLSFPDESSGYTNAIQPVGYYGGPPQMVEPTPSVRSLPNELGGHANYSQAVGNYGNPPQMVETVPGMPHFPSESSGNANYFQVVGNSGNPRQMVEPIPGMLSLPNELRGHANYSQAVGNYGNPPQMVEPIPGMPHLPSESSGHANYFQVVGNSGNPHQMVEPIPGMLSLPNELRGHANYSQAVGNYGNPPQMVEPIPGMPHFPSESSGHANYFQVVGNSGNPPQMVEPTPSMLSLPNELSGHANDSQAVGNYGNPPQTVETIPGIPYFPSESSGHANYFHGNYGNPPQMVEPTHSMTHFQNESSRYANNFQAGGNHGTPPQIEPIPGMHSFTNESNGYVHSNFPPNELSGHQEDYNHSNPELQFDLHGINDLAPQMNMDDIFSNKLRKLSNDDNPYK